MDPTSAVEIITDFVYFSRVKITIIINHPFPIVKLSQKNNRQGAVIPISHFFTCLSGKIIGTIVSVKESIQITS